MFELVDVRKSYGGHAALDGVSLKIPPRRTTSVIGPSGSGKSTILRLLLGLAEPDSGTVLCGGQPLGSLDVIRHRQGVGYLIQSGGLFPHLTARANVTLLARHLGTATQDIDARLKYLASLVRLTEQHLARRPQDLSGGERQRVALMRALMLDPPVLMLDEPLGALDGIVRHRLQDDLKRIFAELEKTAILVTHDLAEAAYLGDQLVLMSNGRIQQSGAPAELVNSPANDFVRDFVSAERKLSSALEAGE